MTLIAYSDMHVISFRQVASLYSAAHAYADVEMEYAYATMHQQFFDFCQLFKRYIRQALASSREDERFHYCFIDVYIEAPRGVLDQMAFYLNYVNKMFYFPDWPKCKSINVSKPL